MRPSFKVSLKPFHKKIFLRIKSPEPKSKDFASKAVDWSTTEAALINEDNEIILVRWSTVYFLLKIGLRKE